MLAEMLGTSFLLIAVVGSGIAGERFAAENTAVAVLANALATGAALFALIKLLAPLSGAHFNPLVTLVLLFRGDITRRAAAAYVLAQLLGAVTGVGMADAMFGEPFFSLSTRIRSGPSQLLGEFVSTFGLIGAVWVCSRTRPSSLAAVVAAYIFGAFWFTPTDFANPALTVARALTNTFSGIRPLDAHRVNSGAARARTPALPNSVDAFLASRPCRQLSESRRRPAAEPKISGRPAAAGVKFLRRHAGPGA